MAKVAVVESTSANTFPLGRVRAEAMTKRKTPSELRGEQLKRSRREISADSSSVSLLDSDKLAGVVRGLKKPESIKNPKYIDTRVDDVYPVKKSSERWRMLYGKEKPKNLLLIGEKVGDRNGASTTSKSGDESTDQLLCDKGITASTVDTSAPIVKESAKQSFQKLEKCSQNKFRTVAELSLGGEKLPGSASIDMDKALKGLVAREILANPGSLAHSSGKFGDTESIPSRNFCSEFQLPGHKSPLDFTLKTTLRLVSSSSVKWCHKISGTGCYSDINKLSNTSESLYSKALQTWAFPQSSLPSSLITAMTLSALKIETDFLAKRQQDWRDSFQSLYYMLRKNICNIFYVYTSQFVAMFIGGSFLGKKKCSCNAYLSQSTRGLRSLLREHDISFSMPLCHSGVEQASADDLAELSEMERQNLGQILHQDSMSDVDNSPQSLLAFMQNENAHGLYDFILNYRYFLSSLTGTDVPVLYSPVPFHNASLCLPEVRCKEIRRANVFPISSGSDTDDTVSIPNLSANSICYSIEIKDAILPPWVVSRLCLAMGHEGRSFESSFTTEPISAGLNVALDSFCGNSGSLNESDKSLPLSGDVLGIPEAVFTPCLRSASLKGLKYSNASYSASVTPL